MGATLRQRDPELKEPSNTERLFNWITQVRTKKIKYLKSRRRNIRVEAVLGYALDNAQQELRNKQIERINEWQKLKQQIAAKTKAKSASLGCEVMDQGNNMDENCNNNNNIINNNNNDIWSGDLCPELNSLDVFMSKLSEIKVPLQR